jgi:hypothetical protein
MPGGLAPALRPAEWAALILERSTRQLLFRLRCPTEDEFCWPRRDTERDPKRRQRPMATWAMRSAMRTKSQVDGRVIRVERPSNLSVAGSNPAGRTTLNRLDIQLRALAGIAKAYVTNLTT